MSYTPRRLFAVLALTLLAGVVLLLLSKAKANRGDYWLYAGSHTTLGGKGIYLFRFEPRSGKLEARGVAAGRLDVGSSPFRILAQIRAGWPSPIRIVRGIEEPTFITVHPNGRYLYSADGSDFGKVSAFNIDSQSGQLVIGNTQPSGGGLPVYLSVDKTGRNLLVANYSGSVAVLPINPAGRLGSAVSRSLQTDSRQRSHAHAIVLSPDNRYALVPDTGLNRIFVYRFDAGRGALTPEEPPSVQMPTGTSPRHFAFRPDGRFGYAVGESGSCVVSMYWNSARGMLSPFQVISTLPADFHGENGGAEILIHPSGKFLYASNRGHDSIAVFRIGPQSGLLSPVEYKPSQGKRPSNLRVDPTGNYLIASDVGSNRIIRFRIDGQTGRLTSLQWFGIPSPMGLSFVAVR